eukprot:g4937.t1
MVAERFVLQSSPSACNTSVPSEHNVHNTVHNIYESEQAVHGSNKNKWIITAGFVPIDAGNDVSGKICAFPPEIMGKIVEDAAKFRECEPQKGGNIYSTYGPVVDCATLGQGTSFTYKVNYHDMTVGITGSIHGDAIPPATCRLVFGRHFVGTLNIIVWSDGFEKSGTRQNLGSVWLMLVSIAPPGKNPLAHNCTFIYAITDDKSANLEMAFRRLEADLERFNNCGRGTAVHMGALDGLLVPFKCNVLLCLMDKPERLARMSISAPQTSALTSTSETQAYKGLLGRFWHDNYKKVLPFMWFSKHFPLHKFVVPFMHTYDEGIVKCVMQYVTDYGSTLGLSSFVMKESSKALEQVKLLRSAFLPVQTRAGGASLNCTGMVAEEYKAAARWLLKWLAVILKGKQGVEQAPEFPKEPGDIDKWSGVKAREFLVSRGLGTKRKDYLPVPPEDPYKYGSMTRSDLRKPVSAQHARDVAKANWQKEPVQWSTDVASLQDMLVSAHNFINYASMRIWNEDVAAGFEERRKKFTCATEKADKKFRGSSLQCEPQKTLLLRKSVLAGLFAHADQSWAFGPLRLLDEALGEKFVQFLKQRYRRSHCRGGARKQAQTAEKFRNMEKFAMTEQSVAGVPEEVVVCVHSLVYNVCMSELVNEVCSSVEDVASRICSALAADDMDDRAGFVPQDVIEEELADRRGSRRRDVSVHKNSNVLRKAMSEGHVLTMWKSSSGVEGQDILYAELPSGEKDPFVRKLQRVRMETAGVDDVLSVHWMALSLDGDVNEESILHLRLEPVLLLREPQINQLENKWWAVSKDYTEFDGERWFHP